VKRGLQVGLLLAAWAFALPTLAETLRGVVIVVIDGDTVLFKPDHDGTQSRAFLKIRLADIDAPEKDQAYGDVATHTLKALVLNQPVEINTVATDAYGRRIAHLQKGALRINTEMVRLGLAWAYDSTRASARSGSESFRAYDSTRASARSGSESFRAYDSTRASARSGSEYPQGASRSFRATSRYQRNAEGVAAQDEARRALRGLWVDAAPTPPWVWRRAQQASD